MVHQAAAMTRQLVDMPAQVGWDREPEQLILTPDQDRGSGMKFSAHQEAGSFRRNQAGVFNVAYSEACPTGLCGENRLALIHRLMDQVLAWCVVSENFGTTSPDDMNRVVETKTAKDRESFERTFNRGPDFQIGLDEIRIGKAKATVNFTMHFIVAGIRDQKGNIDIPLDGDDWGKVQWTTKTMGQHSKPPSPSLPNGRRLPNGRKQQFQSNGQAQFTNDTVLATPEIQLFLILGRWQRGVENYDLDSLATVLDPAGVDAITPLLQRFEGAPIRVIIREVRPDKGKATVTFSVRGSANEKTENLNGSFEIPRAQGSHFYGNIQWNETTVPLPAQPDQNLLLDGRNEKQI